MATVLIKPHASYIKWTNRFNNKNDTFLETSLQQQNLAAYPDGPSFVLMTNLISWVNVHQLFTIFTAQWNLSGAKLGGAQHIHHKIEGEDRWKLTPAEGRAPVSHSGDGHPCCSLELTGSFVQKAEAWFWPWTHWNGVGPKHWRVQKLFRLL